MPSRVVRRLVGKDTAQQNPCLFDHLVGAREQRRWHFVTERLGGLEIDHQLELPVGNSRRTADRGKLAAMDSRSFLAQKTVRGATARNVGRRRTPVRPVPSECPKLIVDIWVFWRGIGRLRTGASPGSRRFASRKRRATWTTGICAKLAL